MRNADRPAERARSYQRKLLVGMTHDEKNHCLQSYHTLRLFLETKEAAPGSLQRQGTLVRELTSSQKRSGAGGCFQILARSSLSTARYPLRIQRTVGGGKEKKKKRWEKVKPTRKLRGRGMSGCHWVVSLGEWGQKAKTKSTPPLINYRRGVVDSGHWKDRHTEGSAGIDQSHARISTWK